MFFNPELNSDAMYETTTDVNVWGGARTVYGGIKHFSINLNLRAPLMAIMSHPIKNIGYIFTLCHLGNPQYGPLMTGLFALLCLGIGFRRLANHEVSCGYLATCCPTFLRYSAGVHSDKGLACVKALVDGLAEV